VEKNCNFFIFFIFLNFFFTRKHSKSSVHGIQGLPAHGAALSAHLRAKRPGQLEWHGSTANTGIFKSWFSTAVGTAIGGRRLARELRPLVANRTMALSIVASSFGGLFARQALCELDGDGSLAGVTLLNFVTLATPHLGLFALPSRAVEGSAASDDSQSNSSSTTIFRLGTVAVLLATWLATWLATLARTVLALLIFPISMADLCLFTPALGALAEPRAVAVLARFAVRICIGSTRGDTLVPAASSLIATGHGGQDRRENKMASTVAASWWITVATWFAENPFSLLAERRRQRVAAMGAQLDLAGWTRVCVTGTHRDTATTSVRRPEMLRTIERLWVDAGKKK
jgi:hypothetical protein